jgi:hypothetical protein
MADFETRVAALTGVALTGTTAPKNTDLDQHLVDGVLDVTHRWISLKAGDIPAFTRKWSSGSAGIEKVANGTGTANSQFTGAGNWVVYESGGSASSAVSVTAGYLLVNPGGDGTYEGAKLPVTHIHPTGGNPFTIGSVYRMSATIRTDSAANAGPVTFGLGGAIGVPVNQTTGDTAGTINITSYTFVADITATSTAGDALIYIANPGDADLFRVDNVTIDEINISPQITPSNMVSVQRESGTNGDWRECRSLPIAAQSRVADDTSLFYASKYNPAFAIEEKGNIRVYPASDGTVGERYQFYYVNNEPVAKDLTALVRTDSDIQFFPDDKVHLVVEYAAIQVLSEYITSLLTDSKLLPHIAVDTDGDESWADEANPVATDLSLLNTAAWASLDFDFDSQNIDFTRWFQVAGDMIQRQEDLELAKAQLEKIAGYIAAYKTTAEVKAKKAATQAEDVIQKYSWLLSKYNGYFIEEAKRQESERAAQQAQAQQRQRRAS